MGINRALLPETCFYKHGQLGGQDQTQLRHFWFGRVPQVVLAAVVLAMLLPAVVPLARADAFSTLRTLDEQPLEHGERMVIVAWLPAQRSFKDRRAHYVDVGYRYKMFRVGKLPPWPYDGRWCAYINAVRYVNLTYDEVGELAKSANVQLPDEPDLVSWYVHLGWLAFLLGTDCLVVRWLARRARASNAQNPTGPNSPPQEAAKEELATYAHDPRLLLVACAAKFAKTDGVVTRSELAVVEELFGNLQLTGEARQQAITTFNQAKVGHATLEAILRFCVEQRWWQPPWLTNALLMFFKLAYADGQPNARTQQTLEAACGWLKEDYQACRQEYEQGRREAAARQSDGVGAAYPILGCQPGDTLSFIKERYRKLVKDYHPDTLSGKNLAPDFLRFAEERFKQIQAAYEAILAARGTTAN